MSLESILQRILDEANSQRETIIKEAKVQVAKVIQEARVQVDRLYQEGIYKEKALFERQKQKLIVNARLDNKKNLLKVKQELIDTIFEKLKSTLKADKFKKIQVALDKEKETSEDTSFFLAKLRQDYETEIAKILFGE